jgi:large subunit ribosomal protein L17
MISHGQGFNRLGRPADQRKALLRSLTTEVIRHGRIRTTLVKAKALRKHVDHMITLAKANTQHTRRQALSYIYDKDLVASLFEQAPERYAERQGGYCRVIKEDLPRRGDGAEMAIIELV